MSRAGATRSDALVVARAVSADKDATEALGRLLLRLNGRHRRLRVAERKLALAKAKLEEMALRIGDVLDGDVDVDVDGKVEGAAE